MSRLPSTRYILLPDEYFQALEPAYHAVFGTGHLTWEWTTNPPIRSFAYPSLFVPAYALVRALHLENTPILIWAPKLVQVVFASAGDLALYQIACTLFTQSHGRVTLFLSLLSPFNVLALTRTLANSTETSLVTIALLYWPYSLFQTRSRTRISLGIAALSCVIRPTASVIWAFLGSQLLWNSSSSRRHFSNLVMDGTIVGLVAASAIAIIDTLYYGALTFTPFSFLKTNLVSGVASFYGVNTFHYYFTQGLPIVLGPSLPFTLLGVRKHIKDNRNNRNTSPSRRTRSLLLGLVAWTIALYSLLAHKEWRFIHPLLPILHLFAADYLIHSNSETKKYATDLQAQDNLKARLTFQLPIRRNHLAYFLAVCLPLNLYLIRWHGSAQIAVTRYLHDLSTRSDRVKSVGVLMPCHSIPGRAYLHLPELTYATGGHRIWEIGCEPPLGLSHTQRETYTSQTDVFFETLGPIRYLDQYFPPSVDPTFPPSREPFTKPGNPPPVQGWNHTWPSHFIMFGALENLSSSSEIQDTVKHKLRGLGYDVVWRIGNGWEEDERRRGGVVVWEWTGLKIDEELMSAAGAFSLDQVRLTALMELAGLSCAQGLSKVYDNTKYSRVLGGDGLVAARHLKMFGYQPTLYMPKPGSKDIYKRLAAQCSNLHIPTSPELPEATNFKSSYDVVLDAIFGFSFKPPARAPFDTALRLIGQSGLPVVSVDIPSGWDVDDGPQEVKTEGDQAGALEALRPDVLVSLTAPKQGARSFQGRHFLGGRFVTPDLDKKFGLNLPKYEGTEQVVEITDSTESKL
ncbi:Alg9-like mannosyltransferase family, partial [Rhizoctonia solani]